MLCLTRERTSVIAGLVIATLAEQWPVLAARVQKVADELSVRLHGRPAK